MINLDYLEFMHKLSQAGGIFTPASMIPMCEPEILADSGIYGFFGNNMRELYRNIQINKLERLYSIDGLCEEYRYCSETQHKFYVLFVPERFKEVTLQAIKLTLLKHKADKLQREKEKKHE